MAIDISPPEFAALHRGRPLGLGAFTAMKKYLNREDARALRNFAAEALRREEKK